MLTPAHARLAQALATPHVSRSMEDHTIIAAAHAHRDGMLLSCDINLGIILIDRKGCQFRHKRTQRFVVLILSSDGNQTEHYIGNQVPEAAAHYNGYDGVLGCAEQFGLTRQAALIMAIAGVCMPGDLVQYATPEVESAALLTA